MDFFLKGEGEEGFLNEQLLTYIIYMSSSKIVLIVFKTMSRDITLNNFKNNSL